MFGTRFLLRIAAIMGYFTLLFIWAVFAIHIPLSIFLDDACYTADQEINHPKNSSSEFQVLIKCLEAEIFTSTLNSISDQLQIYFDQINNFTNTYAAGGYRPTNAQTVNNGSAYQNLITNLNIAQTTLASVNNDTANGAQPTPPADVQASLQNGEVVVSTMQRILFLGNCVYVKQVVNNLNYALCNNLLDGIILVLVGSFVIGILLIPAAIFNMIVGNRFPLLGGSADLKARIQCIVVAQFAIAAVGCAMQLHTTSYYIYLSIFVCAAAVLGLLISVLPLNRMGCSTICQKLFVLVFLLCEIACAAALLYFMSRESKEASKCGANFFNSNCPPKQKAQLIVTALMLALDNFVIFFGIGIAIRLLIYIRKGKTLEDDDSYQDNEMKDK